ncbi:efflux RND transporter periplasmic adaptor subunit [bacterium]|nr:efflux RND transporter periplasmic adaptor subunit [bacterium]
MKRITIGWIQTTALLALILLLTFTLASCGGGTEEEHHEEASTDCSEHNHGAEIEGTDEHEGHDHGAADDDYDDEAEDIDEHEGHDHSKAGDDADEAVLILSARDRSDAGIELATAGAGRLELHTRLLGEVNLNEERLAHVVPPVPGVVREVVVRIGDEVEAGQLLAVLASRELAEARAQYLGARGRRELAVIAYERHKELRERELLAEQEYLDAKQALSEADIELQAAEQTLHALGVTENEVDTLAGSHEAGALTRHELRAPISGTVIELHLVLGETVGEDSDVLALADLSTVWVDFDVPQRELGSVRRGQKMTISASGVDIPDVTTAIDFVSPIIDEATRTALARAEIPNVSGHWRPGLFVTAYVASEQLEIPVIIPRNSVQSLEGETVVFVPAGDAFESVPVVLGRSDGTHVEIETGLRQGEQYVVEGAFALKAEVVTSGLDSHAGHGH